jgi:Domain of unknown function (DUF5658)
MNRRLLILPLALFTLLSGADLFLTWRLLARGLPSVCEYNPVAAWVLGWFGWSGLTVFKAMAAGVVVAAALAIAARRPRAACGVLAFGCITLAAVVFYGAGFADIHRVLGNSALDEDAVQAARGLQLEDGIGETNRRGELKRQLTDGMVAGRLDFREAVDRLVASEFGDSAFRLMRQRRLYSLDSDRDCCATNLLVYALGSVQDDPARWRRWAPVWLSDYQSHFRVSTPPPWEWQNVKNWPPLTAPRHLLIGRSL